eukprot:8917078-Pyramimonas_sp.AAC.2
MQSLMCKHIELLHAVPALRPMRRLPAESAELRCVGCRVCERLSQRLAEYKKENEQLEELLAVCLCLHITLHASINHTSPYTHQPITLQSSTNHLTLVNKSPY